MPYAGLPSLRRISSAPAMMFDHADMRKMMTVETIDHNVSCIKNQLSRFINFDDGEDGAIIANNADWLRNLNYIEFLREVGTGGTGYPCLHPQNPPQGILWKEPRWLPRLCRKGNKAKKKRLSPASKKI